jgi:tetratricopeptide (TPR) repeat protein
VKILTRSALVVATALALVPAALAAQDSQCSAMRFRGNFRLNGAMQHLGQADSSSFPDQKRTRATNALRVLTEASAAGGVDLFTLNFMMGRTYALLGNLEGADSSFSKAAALVATDTRCLNEITRLRRNMWIPLQTEAATLMQGNNFDSALVLLRKGNLIYRDDPSGYLNMASAYLSLQKQDSAAMMFRLASKAGTAPDRAELRQTAAFNAARLLQQSNNLPAAESAYREYIVMRPRDVEAKGSLAALLTQMNRANEAAAIYDTLMAQPDSLDSFGLFSVGVALFRGAQNDSLPANAERRQRGFRSAARAFELGLTKNRANRDALFNLVNAYIAANDTAKVLDAAQRLAATDSLNRQTLTLLARGYQMNRRPNDVVTALMRRDSLPVEVVVLRFDPRDSIAAIRGGIQNLQSRERPEGPLTIEFLNAAGDVVATERVAVPTLGRTGNPGSAYDFTLQVSGRGIVAYRYKLN